MKLHIKRRLQFMKVGQLRKLSGLMKWSATFIISLGIVAEAIAADMVKINFRDADIEHCALYRMEQQEKGNAESND